MVAVECHAPEPTAPPLPTAPPSVEQALCVTCKHPAVRRCDECFDEEEGCLYLCAQEACFAACHPERQRRKHLKSVVVWNSKAQPAAACCATHTGHPLALWCVPCSTLACALCSLRGAHAGHETPLVADARKGLQEQLRGTVEELEDEKTKLGKRLEQLSQVQAELASGKGAVGDAKRALQEIKALLVAKAEALDCELDETAAKWSAQAAKDHEQLSRHLRSVESLAASMRTTCGEVKVEEAQQVATAYLDQCAQRDALRASPPSVSVGVLTFNTDALRQAVTDLSMQAVVREEVPLCLGCRALLEDATPDLLCGGCAKAVRLFQTGGSVLWAATEDLRAKKAVVLAAVAQDTADLQFASAELRADKEVVLAALKAPKWTWTSFGAPCLQLASAELKADQQVVLACLKKGAMTLGDADEALRADKRVVLAAVADNGLALRHASAELQADREVVLRAVAMHRCGTVLQYASTSLRNDREVVRRAVASDSAALQFASESLRADEEFQPIKSSPFAYHPSAQPAQPMPSPFGFAKAH